MSRPPVPESHTFRYGRDVKDLTGIAEEVQQRVSYMRTLTPEVGEAGWCSCAELVADRHALQRTATAGADKHSAATAGADSKGGDEMVAASLFVQSYAFKVAAVPVAAFAVGLPIPLPRLKDTTVRPLAGRIKGVHYDQATTLASPGDAAALAEALFGDHLEPLTAALRDEVRLGERLVWGNIATSVATAFRAIEGAARDRNDIQEQEAVRDAAPVLFAASEQWTASTGRFEFLGTGWFWTRTSCCLYYRQSSGRRCDDCSLYTADELRELRSAQMRAGQ